MLLSIDRVLRLLGDGKSIDKIAQMAECNSEDVVEIIEKARMLLSKHEKNSSRKKIILKKRQKVAGDEVGEAELELEREIHAGSEFSVIPVQSSLTMYVAGREDEEGNTALGIEINDRAGQRVGKVSLALNLSDEFSAGLAAIIKALKIARFFSTWELKIRTHMELCIRYIEGDKKMEEKYSKYNKQLQEIRELLRFSDRISFENISSTQNDKAIFFANQALSR